jgi:predicted MPP superfamily phosphohydrolase
MWSRRKLMLSGAAAVGGFGLGLYTWRIEPHWVEFVHRDLPIDRLPAALEGARLVQVSDLHVGPEVDSGYLIDVLERTAALDPDIVVFTGDFVTWGGPGTVVELRDVLDHFPAGRLATVGALGNHDSGARWRSRRYAEAVTEQATDAGIELLRNSVYDVEGLRIVGLEDLWGPNFAPQGPLARVPAGAAAIVLSHNPDAVDLDVWADYRGWILCGHTHGGQCKPPFLPPPLLPVKNRRYTAGEFDLGEGRRMYINRGVGHKERVRFNARPEVTIFTLARA